MKIRLCIVFAAVEARPVVELAVELPQTPAQAMAVATPPPRPWPMRPLPMAMDMATLRPSRPAGPTGVCEEFVQSRTTRLSVQRQLEERGCKRTLRSNSDEAAPPENPGCLSSWAERRWRGRGTGARKLAEEGGGFGVPAAANLKPKDDQAALPAAVELGIGLPAFAPGSCAHSKAWLGLFAGAWFAIPRNRANQRSVDGKLVTMPEREAVAYDLDAPSWIGTSRFMAFCQDEAWPLRKDDIARSIEA
ncbi:hypothetical protein AK812_SmicGene41240 [Symbiodinium microadriaticum]|uniref:Uncharacterized protein n=1 Tax=Symbiodinium microadriaticum TaxID=2951 RepID=A0A1Q9C6M0_SYMMI|nr:hypothetical protein AK812_SmicGene41240 [Symbiodinium microadriaticum]